MTDNPNIEYPDYDQDELLDIAQREFQERVLEATREANRDGLVDALHERFWPDGAPTTTSSSSTGTRELPEINVVDYTPGEITSIPVPGATPPAPTAVPGYPTASEEVSERLWTHRNNPDVLTAYDYHYGPGAADAYLNMRSGTPDPEVLQPVPAAAIEWLLSRGHDNLAAQIAFDNRYGAGSAEYHIYQASELVNAEEEQESRRGFGFYLGEAGRAIGGGVQDAFHGIMGFTGSINEELENFTGTMVRTEDGWRYMRGDELRQYREDHPEYDQLSPRGAAEGVQELTDIIPENETLGGNLGRGVITFLVPYGAGARMMGGANTLMRGLALGAAVDFSVWDPDDPNMTGALAEYFGIEDNLMVDLLATDPDDPEFMNRARNALEGGALGMTTEVGLMMLGRMARAMRRGRAAMEAGDEAGMETARQELQDIADELEANNAQLAEEAEAEHAQAVEELSAQADEDLAAIQARRENTLVLSETPGGFPQAPYVGDTLGHVGGAGDSPLVLSQGDRVGTPEGGEGLPNTTAPDGAPVLRQADEGVGGFAQAPYVGDTVGHAGLTGEAPVARGETSGLEMPNAPRTGGVEAQTQAPGGLQGTPQAGGNQAPLTSEAPVNRPSAGHRLTQQELDQITDWADTFAANPGQAMSTRLPYRSPNTYRSFEDAGANLSAMAEVLHDRFQSAIGGGRQTWDEVNRGAAVRLREMAEIVGSNPDELVENWGRLNLDPNRLSMEIMARDNMILSLEADVRQLAESINRNSYDSNIYRSLDEARADFAYRMELISNLLKQQATTRTNIGRALNSMKATRSKDSEILDMIRTGLDGAGVNAMARMVAEAPATGRTVARLARQASPFKRWYDKIQHFRINAMLSGPGTHEVNITSTAINTAATPLRTMLGGNVRHGLRQYRGMLMEAREVLGAAWTALKHDAPVLDPGNTKMDLDDIGQTDSLRSRIIGLPSRALAAQDELFKQASYRGWIYADAMAMADDLNLRGQARVDYVQKYLRDSFTPEGVANIALRKNALQMARRSTFTEDLRPGSIAHSIQRMASGDSLGSGVVRFVMPFIRTPANIIKQTYQHIPGIQFLSKELREDLVAGGARAAQARGKIVIGGAITTIGLYAVDQGYITGYGPRDPQIRREWMQAGNRPYSIRRVDENGNVSYQSYERLEPPGMVLGIIADAYEVLTDQYNQDPQSVMEILGALAMVLGSSAVDNSFTTGVDSALDLMTGEDWERDRAMANYFGSFIPNIISQTNGDPYFRDIRSFTDVAHARTLGYEDVAPQRNILGEPVLRPTRPYDPLGLFTPNPYVEQDPVMQELSRLSIQRGTAFRHPPHSIYLDGRRQSLRDIPHPDYDGRNYYDVWIEQTGTVEINGMTLRESLEHLMDSPEWDQMPDETIDNNASRSEGGGMTRRDAVMQIISGYRRAARATSGVTALEEQSGQEMADNYRDDFMFLRDNPEESGDRLTGPDGTYDPRSGQLGILFGNPGE